MRSIKLYSPTESMTFPLQLDPIPLADGENWLLEKHFKMVLIVDGRYTNIIAPKGFKTNFASIPQWAWSLIGAPWGRYGKAAVIHDFVYQKGVYTRKECDFIFLLGMEACQVERLKRYSMYYAVRLGGHGYFKNKDKR